MGHTDPHPSVCFHQSLDCLARRTGMLLVIRLQPGPYRSAHFGRLALPPFADVILPA